MAWDSDADILSVFKQFGYQPSEAEINALKPSFGEGMGTNALSSVAQYVNFKNAEAERAKNDPLAALQTRMEDSVNLMKNQVQGLYGQLQDTLSAAPQLFGNLTPDQIKTYLSPLMDTFKQQTATVQTIMGSRGLAASSTENNSLAQTDEQFKNQVFSTGLNVGMTSQANKAKAIQDQINNLFGLTGTETQIAGKAAGQRSEQNLGQSNLIASLPTFLNANAMQMAAAQKALNPDTGGFQNTFDQVTGDISKGMNALQSIAMIPSQFKTAAPASTPGVNAPNLPSTSLYQGAPGSPAAYGLDPSQNALFEAPAAIG